MIRTKLPNRHSAPYIDPISGLNVFNSAVGAWEAAIQPPVVNYPSLLTWRLKASCGHTTNSELYIYNNGLGLPPLAPRPPLFTSRPTPGSP